jgi:hypothetical protein
MTQHGEAADMDVAARARRSILAVVVILAACCAAQVTAAQAASTLTITVGADPVESITTQVGATGSVDDDNQYLTISYKPVGATACGANPSADDGAKIVSGRGTLGPAAYAITENTTFDKAGSYLICAWLVRSGAGDVTASSSKVVDVRIPKLSLTLGVPAAVNPGQTFQVTAVTQAEAKRYVNVYILVDTGRGCPANADAAHQAYVSRVIGAKDIVGGPVSTVENVTLTTPGVYLLCGYINYKSGGDAPQASAAAAFTVLAPPPAPPSCVVPVVIKDEPLAAARGRLVAAACTPGKVRYVASARYARGSVFKLAPVPGTTLPNAAKVDLFVSSGAPCIVPAIPKSRSLATVKRRLAASGCTVGTIRHKHSAKRKRGRVISLTAKTGQRLAPRAKVGIVVSRGR